MPHVTTFAQSTQEIPYGYCQCGCGQKTAICLWDNPRYGHVKGQPKRFRRGHGSRKHPLIEHPNPSGLCMCGCGQPAPLSQVTRHKEGYIKGLPKRYISGHQARKCDPNDEGPNPSGLCQCGCGQLAPIATYSDLPKGIIVGKPMRFIHNHHQNLFPSLEERFWAKVDKRGTNDCWEWTGSRNGAGYGKMGGNDGSQYAHRISYEIRYGPLPEGLYACHHCDNPPCCNPAHLFAGTHADNMQDMLSKGRGKKTVLRGEELGNSKLTESQVIEIRKRYSLGERQIDLAVAYGVGQSTISSIVRRERWTHVE